MLSVFIVLFELFISLVISIQLYSSIWWTTVFAFPLMMIISRIVLHPLDYYQKKAKPFLDVILTLSMYIYLIIHVYIFSLALHKNI